MAERDEQLEAYFASMQDLVAYEPFKLHLEELRQQGEAINSVENCTGVDELYFRKGQLNIIGTLLNLEVAIGLNQEEYNKSLEPHNDESEWVV